MSFSRLDEDLVPIEVAVSDDRVRVSFRGGLEISLPTSQFPRLKEASASQRATWEIVGRGRGIHWPEVDEDLSIRGLFQTYRRTPESQIEQVPALVSDSIKTTGRLNAMFPGRPFTPDGHLVGSIGEVVAEYVYGLTLEPCSTPQIDARTVDGRTVQVKLTGSSGQSYAFRWPPMSKETCPEILLCLKLSEQGFEEIYNGHYPTDLLEEKLTQKNGQVKLSISLLRQYKSNSSIDQIHSFESLNRWFTPELAEVA